MFLLRGERHQAAAIYNGNMYHQSPYVDANSHYVDVARSFNGHVMSASPNEQRPTSYSVGETWNLHNRGMQLMNLNFRASATSFNMPVNNTICSSDQYRTPHVQEGISKFYPSATDSQYAGSSPNMPMNGGIGHASVSNLASYPQTSYTTPREINCSVAYETKNIYDSDHLCGYGRVNGDSAGAYVPNITGDEVALAALKTLAQNKKISDICLGKHEKGLVPDYDAIRARVLKEDKVLPIDQIGEREYSTVVHMSSPITAACYTPPIQLQNFGNTRVSLRKNLKALGGNHIQSGLKLRKSLKPTLPLGVRNK